MSNIPQTHNISNIAIIANFVFPHIWVFPSLGLFVPIRF